jgi:uncharacterized protein (UPF0276 family)
VDGRRSSSPAIGLGYRWPIDRWIRDHLDHFDMLEITVDHCISGRRANREAIYDLVGRVPLTAHGVGLSIGTDTPLDSAYLDRVAEVVARLGAWAYSEHLAFTRVPGRDLANLLPLPRTPATARAIVAKVRQIQSRIPVPFLLENIAQVFDWPDSVLPHAEFFKRICGETGAGILLDVENLYLNAQNHEVHAHAFLDALPAGIVAQVHVAGGLTVRAEFLERPFLADTHDRPVPGGALDLLDHVLARHAPSAIVLERDERLDVGEEILGDITRIRARLKLGEAIAGNGEASAAAPG